MQPKNGVVMIAGKPVELRFDVMALTTAQTLMKGMGFNRPNTWSLADLPYDLGEEVILLINGINGARRAEKNNNMISLDQVQEMVQDHLDYLGENISKIEDEQEAMEAFQEAQRLFMEEIGSAVKASLGFRRGGAGSGAKGGAGAKARKAAKEGPVDA